MIFRRKHAPTITGYTSLADPTLDPNSDFRAALPTKQAPLAQVLSTYLQVLKARRDLGEFTTYDVGFVVQAHVNSQRSYYEWRRSWHERLQTVAKGSGGPYSANQWPEATGQIEDAYAVVLVPVAAGTASLVPTGPPMARAIKGQRNPAGRRRQQLPAVGNPLQAAIEDAKHTKATSPQLLAMDLLKFWIQRIPDDEAPRIAPPVIEWARANGRQILKREVLSWDLDWPLPPPQLPTERTVSSR